MGAFGPMHWIIVLIVVLVLFGGRGKLSSFMGDAAKGIRAFKDGLKDDPQQETAAKAIPETTERKEEARG